MEWDGDWLGFGRFRAHRCPEQIANMHFAATAAQGFSDDGEESFICHRGRAAGGHLSHVPCPQRYPVSSPLYQKRGSFGMKIFDSLTGGDGPLTFDELYVLCYLIVHKR